METCCLGWSNPIGPVGVKLRDYEVSGASAWDCAGGTLVVLSTK